MLFRSAGALQISEGAIPWNIIIQYCKHKGFDPETEELFTEVIMSMDGAWLEEQNKKYKK